MNWQNTIGIVAKYSARLAGLTILASAGLVSLEVIFRNLEINIRLYSFELTNYGFACAVAFALSYATAQRSHIRIDLFYRFTSLKTKAVLDITSILIIFLLASGMAYYAWKVVIHSHKLNAKPNTTLDIPLAIPQAIWAVGLTLFSLVSFSLLLRAIYLFYRGDAPKVRDEIGLISDKSNERQHD